MTAGAVDFADWVTGSGRAEGLPELYARPERSRDRWQLFPWYPMHDVSTLLAWASRMDPGTVRGRAEFLPRAESTVLRLYGVLAGEPVELVGCTRRPVPGHDGRGSTWVPAGPVELDVLYELAEAEWAASTGAPLFEPPPPPGPGPPPETRLQQDTRDLSAGSLEQPAPRTVSLPTTP